MNIQRNNITVPTEQFKFQKGKMAEAGVEYPGIDLEKLVKEQGFQALVEFFGQEELLQSSQQKLNLICQQAYRNAVGWEVEEDENGNKIKEGPTREFNEDLYNKQVSGFIARGENLGDMEDQRDALWVKLNGVLSDLEKTSESSPDYVTLLKNQRKIVQEMSVLNQNINDRKAEFRRRRAGEEKKAA